MRGFLPQLAFAVMDEIAQSSHRCADYGTSLSKYRQIGRSRSPRFAICSVIFRGAQASFVLKREERIDRLSYRKVSPTMKDLSDLSLNIASLRAHYRSGTLAPAEVIREVYRRIRAYPENPIWIATRPGGRGIDRY